MLGVDRRAARYVWTAALVLAGLYLVYLVRKTLFVFVLALLFAYLLSPLVNLIDRFLPGKRTRTLSLALAYIIFIGAVVVFATQIGSRIADQARELVKDLPNRIAAWQTPDADLPPALDHARLELLARVKNEIGTRAGELIGALPQAGLKFLTVASDLAYVVIIPILSFFFLKDGRAMASHILDLVDAGPRHALLEDVLADVHLLLAHYMHALVVLSAATFTSYSIAFSIMGVPYGILLAALAGILEFIPTVGPVSAVLCILLVAVIGRAPVVGVLIFVIVYRLFQDYFLSPHLMREGVQLHPLLVLFGVFAGAEVAGVAGTILSVPVLAMVRILYLRMRKARLGAPAGPIIPVVP
ncbi:MAG: AI-2E family transporter [Bryobacteraceae bacterium]